eukprot:XP_011683461.1 PREDICTED: uncharacterized protein LOC105447299 [Strongylocentrotus purpuratus]
MADLHYPRPCGCTGIRSCLVCEGKDIHVKNASTGSEYLQALWRYCYLCGNIQPPPHIEMGQSSTKQPTPDTVCPDHHATQGFRLPGIQVIPEFITDEEEMEMVHMIEESPWKSSQSGRFKQVSSSEVIHITVVTEGYTNIDISTFVEYQCWPSVPDIDASLSFGRSAPITTDRSPPGDDGRVIPYLRVVRFSVGDGWNSDGFGPFYCDASKPDRDVTRVTTFFQRNDAKFLSSNGLFTTTVNVNDSGVMINMTSRNNPDESDNVITWMKDGSEVLTPFDGQTQISFPNPIQTSDQGIYEIYYDNERNQNRGGLYRLIVRECPAGKWGPPECYGICDKCYNGGVCDDKSGLCVCPNNFKGPNCLEIPDECENGYFGPQCTDKCHCFNDEPCDKDTGECPEQKCALGYRVRSDYSAPEACETEVGLCTGQCLNSWIGPHCQIAPSPINVAITQSTTSSFTVSWSTPLPFNINGNIQKYVIRYKRTDPAGDGNYKMEEVLTGAFDGEPIVMDLVSAINYTVQVRTVNEAGSSNWSEPVIAKTILLGNDNCTRISLGTVVASALVPFVIIVVLLISTVVMHVRIKQRRLNAEPVASPPNTAHKTSSNYGNPAFDGSDTHSYQDVNTDIPNIQNLTDAHTYQELKKPNINVNYQNVTESDPGNTYEDTV